MGRGAAGPRSGFSSPPPWRRPRAAPAWSPARKLPTRRRPATRPTSAASTAVPAWAAGSVSSSWSRTRRGAGSGAGAGLPAGSAAESIAAMSAPCSQLRRSGTRVVCSSSSVSSIVQRPARLSGEGGARSDG